MKNKILLTFAVLTLAIPISTANAKGPGKCHGEPMPMNPQYVNNNLNWIDNCGNRRATCPLQVSRKGYLKSQSSIISQKLMCYRLHGIKGE